MMIPLVVVGAGGFGRETLDVVAALNAQSKDPVFDLLGVIDADPSGLNLERLRAREVAYLGTEAEWIAQGISANFVVAIGSPNVRENVARLFREAGFSAATIVHPSAGVGAATKIGAGSIVCGGAQISTNVRVGEHVHINPNATIGHDTILADFVSVNPAAVVSGDVTVDSHVLIGAGAVVLQGLAVGTGSIVGAAACVVRNVPATTTVKGVPAQ